jgi:DNA repair protein RecN (Recombination protein N)
LGNLHELGEIWIDFHGPGEPQKLLKEKWQRELLDRYAQVGPELKEYQDGFQAWKQILKKIDELKTQDHLSPDELEFIQNQIRLIDQADVSEKSIEALERDYIRSTQARELTGLSTNIDTALRGDKGVVEQLGVLLQTARELAEIDGESNALAGRLESAIIELEDLSECYGQLASDCEFNEESEHAIQEKMNLWLELSRKYGNSVKAVLGKRENLANKISMQGDIEGSIERLKKEAKEREDKLEKRAESLRVKRQKAARELSKKAAKLIGLLGFKKADIQIGILRESGLKEYGNCSCQFLFSPNPGQDLLPLNKIASSGEIARVMLALKAILAQVDDTSVLVFDEADANVGGEIANVVGVELASLGKRHQVFSVTHLPQVAGKASGHFIVTKDQNKNSTSIAIRPIHEKKSDRLVELARMLGDRHSQSALNHANELLLQ